MAPSLLCAAVRKANQLSAAQLASYARDLVVNEYKPVVVHASNLSQRDRQAIWTIFEENMRSLYTKSSAGWNPPEKRKELFDVLSRFILYKDAVSTVKAYTMFRFEYEEEERLLYCYELQVASDAQGLGFGKKLIDTLTIIGQKTNMHKVMLTVFIENGKAYGFYRHVGFAIDESSPTYVEGVESNLNEVDYHILSKRLE